MALSLANVLARVQRIVPTTSLSAYIQDAILEKCTYLTTLEDFPFQEVLSGAPDMTLGQYYVTIPTTIQILKRVTILTEDYDTPITLMDAEVFSEVFPAPGTYATGTPTHASIREGETKLYFNCPPDQAYALQWEGYAITDPASVSALGTLTELAKLTLVHLGAGEAYGSLLGEYDKGHMENSKGNEYFPALKKRIQRNLEADSRFMSPLAVHAMKKRIVKD